MGIDVEFILPELDAMVVVAGIEILCSSERQCLNVLSTSLDMNWKPGDRINLRILKDRTSLEIFAQDGRTVIGKRAFSSSSPGQQKLIVSMSAKVSTLKVLELEECWR